ncbi:MAG TPA: hypothetical protein ENJ00_00180 [Phycisphaerales bacterium]|nr:hypothetical protein [Phycisphaerales bacterium]
MMKQRCLAVLVLLIPIGQATAQAPINSNVALQPSRSGLILRQQFRFTQATAPEPADADISQVTSRTTVVYGATDAVTLILDSPTILYRQINPDTGRADTDAGFGDLSLLTKIRLFRDDPGPNDTTRFDLIAGVELPTGQDAFSADSINPIFGGVISHIFGRHAISADALWKFNTGGDTRGDDLLIYDIAYSYRFIPETYASESPSAVFGSIELNGLSSTNGDQEFFLSPGLQYVTVRYILEATVQIPVWQDLDHRAERDVVVGFGFRVQF